MSGWVWWIDHRLGLNRFLYRRTKEASERGLRSLLLQHIGSSSFMLFNHSLSGRMEAAYMWHSVKTWTGAWYTNMRKAVTRSRRFGRSNQQQQSLDSLDSDVPTGGRRGSLLSAVTACERLGPRETVCSQCFGSWFSQCKHADSWCRTTSNKMSQPKRVIFNFDTAGLVT